MSVRAGRALGPDHSVRSELSVPQPAAMEGEDGLPEDAGKVHRCGTVPRHLAAVSQGAAGAAVHDDDHPMPPPPDRAAHEAADGRYVWGTTPPELMK